MPTYIIALFMLASILFLVAVTTYSPFNLNFFSTFNFISNIIIISIRQKNRMSLYGFFDWILLQTLLGVSWTYVIPTTSRRGWIIVHVVTMIVCCSGCCSQYLLVFSCMDQIYFSLTTNSPAKIIFSSIVVISCCAYASDMNL